METGKYRLVKRMRLAARIIGFGMVGFGGTMLVGEAVSEYLREGWAVITEVTPTDPGVLLVVIGAVALAGCILSRWRERLAGILLVSVAAALGAHIATYAGRNHALVWAMVGLPFLVSGLLFLNAWRLSKELT
ncbi:MAG: hypothetical protein IMY77_00400 [Chloroflexi bacterium]|nr:hypothetical protein [Chloroflexota bacterium]